MPQQVISIQSTDTFLVTGFYYNSTRKFRAVYADHRTALNINLWRGHVWLLRNGHRTLLKSVYN